jgi:hypothetical protein
MNSQESPLTESLRELTLPERLEMVAASWDECPLPEWFGTAQREAALLREAAATLRTSTPTAQDGATMREALERLRILLDWRQEHGESLTRAFRDAPERPTVADLRLIADGAQQQQPSEVPELSWVRPKRETLTLPCSRCARQSVRTVPICVRCWHEKICTPECDGCDGAAESQPAGGGTQRARHDWPAGVVGQMTGEQREQEVERGA